MTPRECFNRVLRFEQADYVPNIDFGPMNQRLLAEWRREGMPEGVGFSEYFGLHRVEDFRHINFGPIPGVPDSTLWPGVMRDDGKTCFMRDSWGRETERVSDEDYADGARRILRGGVRTRADWEPLRAHFHPHPHRYPDHWDENNWAEKKHQWAGRDWPLAVRGPSMIGEIKEVMGFENFCIQLHEDRKLIEDMIEARTSLAEDILPRAFEEVDVDVLHFWEDCAFNGGPILSPEMFEQLAVPRYRRLTDLFRRYGGEIVSVDSDGDIRKLIPLWLKAGVNHLWPMEVRAGMDVVACRREYGHDLTMRGGIDKFALRQGKEAIDRELDRVEPVVRDGGYIPSVDHGIPNGTRFENVCYYMEQKRKLLGVG